MLQLLNGIAATEKSLNMVQGKLASLCFLIISDMVETGIAEFEVMHSLLLKKYTKLVRVM